jgi:hypothetical protein
MCSLHMSEVLATCICPISAVVGAKHGLLSSQHRDATSCKLHKTPSNQLRKDLPQPLLSHYRDYRSKKTINNAG